MEQNPAVELPVTVTASNCRSFLARLPAAGAPLTEATVRQDGQRVVVEGYCAATGRRFSLAPRLKLEGADVLPLLDRASSLLESSLLVVVRLRGILMLRQTRSSTSSVLEQAAAAARTVEYAVDLLEQALGPIEGVGSGLAVVVGSFHTYPVVPTAGRDSSLVGQVQLVADALEDAHPRATGQLRRAAQLLEWIWAQDLAVNNN